ncbi:hypothetical protein [Timonella sp. A28]|uniref:hypothetical protein n=1 Tax=Timonella sp. A28 TaxID=3442640 RepID=UPI003EBF0ED1
MISFNLPDRESLDTFFAKVGVVSIGLTTTWTGEFSLDDGQTWIPVHGTATTTERSKPITVGERKPVLVNPTP